MNKKAFEPILIGRYQDRIESQTESWMRLIFAANHLAAAWNQYFAETLDLKELAIILNVPDLKQYIQEKHIRQDPKHVDFIKTMKVKIQKLIELVEIPSFDHLLSAVSNVKAAIYPDPMTEINKFKPVPAGKNPVSEVGELEFNKWEAQVFNGLNFSFISELESEITEKHSVYTRNERENAAYLYMKRLAETLNVLNDCGLALTVQDYPKLQP